MKTEDALKYVANSLAARSRYVYGETAIFDLPTRAEMLDLIAEVLRDVASLLSVEERT